MSRNPKVLAISSGGGHWIQLLRLRPSLVDCKVTYATVRSSYSADVGDESFRVIRDANRWHKLNLIFSALDILWLLLLVRPDVIITTGAATGYFAARFGKWLGARVVWVDSMANAEELSMSGQKVIAFSDLLLTQWPHVACAGGPQYVGGVL